MIKHKRFMEMAFVIAKGSTCPRRQIGCILVNGLGQIVSTGYNGVPRRVPHCKEQGSTCQGHNFDTGQRTEACHAVHAEANALLQCSDVEQILACYVTTEPCIECVKMLMNTSCHTIYYRDEFSSSARELWESQGREMIKIEV